MEGFDCPNHHVWDPMIPRVFMIQYDSIVMKWFGTRYGNPIGFAAFFWFGHLDLCKVLDLYNENYQKAPVHEAHRAKWDQSHQLQVDEKYNSSYIQVWNTPSENPMDCRPFLGAPGLLWQREAEAFPVRLLPRLGISFVTPDSGPVTGGTDGMDGKLGGATNFRTGWNFWENYIISPNIGDEELKL